MYDLRFWRLWLWRMQSSGMWCHVTLLRTDVSEEYIASVMRVIRISDLGTTLAITSNWSTLILFRPDDRDHTFHRNIGSYESHTTSHLKRLHTSTISFSHFICSWLTHLKLGQSLSTWCSQPSIRLIATGPNPKPTFDDLPPFIF
jgi:hypothetical protein